MIFEKLENKLEDMLEARNIRSNSEREKKPQVKTKYPGLRRLLKDAVVADAFAPEVATVRASRAKKEERAAVGRVC